MGGAAGWETVPKADALDFTPTWIVAGVCSLIVFISLAAERCLHYIGKTLKKKNQKALFQALLKVKEELMLLGFISLLLTVSQGVIQKTCIPPSWTNHMLPCKRTEARTVTAEALALGGRRLLSESGPQSEHCQNKGKVPLLSPEALHQLHIFIFVLAITHVVLSAVTMILGVEQEMPRCYVVYVGRVPGVYEEWKDCQKQVNNFSGNSYQGYESREVAEEK